MLMTDAQIREAVEKGEIGLDPFDDRECLQPASYDLRIGSEGFTSSSKEKLDLGSKGLLALEAGEFAVVTTMEKVRLSPKHAGALGLRSDHARRGLQMLSGPQIDPGFEGVLCVRLVNLAPKKISLAYGEPFLTVQLFELAQLVARPYTGRRQGQTGLAHSDVRDLLEAEGMTIGEVIRTLSGIAAEVSELRGSVAKLSWSIPLIVGLGIAVIGVIAAMK